MGLSAPVAFQYPVPAARFGLEPFGYFLSLGEKKYHSFSPYSAISEKQKEIYQIIISRPKKIRKPNREF
jgi:hypothetical protein